MNEPTRGEYDVDSVEAIDTLRAEIKKIHTGDNPVKRLSDLFMNGHDGSGGYLSFGNTKIAKNVAIFNMNSATDCPNANSSVNDQTDTGACQVPWKDCYAHKAEAGLSPKALDKRRRQEYLWDNVDALTFAKALEHCFDRKQRDITAIRFSEAGDFRHNGDIIKVNRIAKIVDTDVYTYSASHKLNWDEATHFTVNQSNNLDDYGARLFSAVTEPDAVPDEGVLCPFEMAKHNGVDTDERPKCGDCRLCIDQDADDVYVLLH